MSTTTKTINQTKVITGEVRFSYANVWEPVSINGSEAKYSVSILIPKSDTKTLNLIKQAVETAKVAGAVKFGGKVPNSLKLPLRDGDVERDEDSTYKGCYFINANCKTRPGIVDHNITPIIDTTEFYSGCYGRASLSFYAYNSNGSKGIACGLNHLMKTKDGDSLGGRARVEDDFAEFSMDNDNDFLS